MRLRFDVIEPVLPLRTSTVPPVRVRPEEPRDRPVVAAVHREAFGDDGEKVAVLVERLRALLGRGAGASLVAEEDGEVVGHVLLTRSVLDAPSRQVEVVVLSPLGVRASHQRKGIGGALVTAGLEEVDRHGVPAVFLEGSPSYYPRFGFEPGGSVGFRKPSLRIPDPAFMVARLSAYEPWMTGTLVYDQIFWDLDLVGLRDGPDGGTDPDR